MSEQCNCHEAVVQWPAVASGSYTIKDGVLVCSNCGKPSRSKKWRANAYGIAEALRMEQAEGEVSRMTEKQKLEELANVLDPQDRTMLKWGAYQKLSYKQLLLCFERGVKRSEDDVRYSLDDKIIQSQAPAGLLAAVSDAKAGVERAEKLAREAERWAEGRARKCREVALEGKKFAFSRNGVPQKVIDDFNKARRQREEAEQLLVLATQALDGPRLQYAAAVGKLDGWVRAEHEQRRQVVMQRDEVANPTPKPPTIEQRLAALAKG